MLYASDSRFMDDVRFIDESLGIYPTAMAVLAVLKGTGGLTLKDVPNVDKLADRLRFGTYPWYNGRERGYCLSVARMDKDATLFITFGENRKSDDIFVDAWEVLRFCGTNPPTVDSFTDEAYAGRKTFNFDQHYKAAQYIRERIMQYIVAKAPVSV